MWVNLVTGERLRAVRKDVAGIQVDHTLRYLRHGRARSSWNDIAALSRYRLIDLTCTVSFQQSRYWIPAIERWLYATSDEPYFGLTNLQVAFAAPTVHKRSQFLKSLAVDFETNLIESASLQTVEILWTATKLLLDDSGDEVDGYLTLNTQSTALTAADARSKHYFTVKRS
ncbi:hypothetical protein SAMN05192558_101263 [Actinokineospora alba]|uniref:Uncharacterized protein n=2 Tax=Actinokineospora alba TaxID=504798 RepID=A0A1H0F7D9_9PSEU|nr:hypothetical protein C8E96_4959 [Actinokineospora alba]SDI18143.1 hypothetical protein SAMN05421871_103607 [Actinokineospora alba]SDN90617.1 hypothetical protein SAMN05192558_101263 [Actinokineospora alba]